MGLTLALALVYGLPFAAMFALNGPRRLAVGAALAVAAVALHFFVNRNATGDAGMSVYIFGAVAAIGFVSGAAARIVLLARPAWRRSPWITAAVGLAFFFGVPLTLRTWSKAEQRATQRRYAPPSAACKTRLHEAQVGDATVRLPLLWGITVYSGRDVSGSISFYQQEKAREFCESTDRGKPRLTLVRIDFPQLETGPQRLQPICLTPRREAWWLALCRHERQERIDLYSIALFDPARFDSERYLSFTVEPAGPGKTRYEERWSEDGPFMRAVSGRDIYWRGPPREGAASPYLARCYEDRERDGPLQGLRCKAGYRLSPGAALVYDFYVVGDEFAAEARRQDERVYAIARSLMPG